jgi:hypothetical protein
MQRSPIQEGFFEFLGGEYRIRFEEFLEIAHFILLAKR